MTRKSLLAVGLLPIPVRWLPCSGRSFPMVNYSEYGFVTPDGEFALKYSKIITGKLWSCLSLRGSTTRAEKATMIMKFCNRNQE